MELGFKYVIFSESFERSVKLRLDGGTCAFEKDILRSGYCFYRVYCILRGGKKDYVNNNKKIY